MRVESLIARAEKLKAKSSYQQSLRVFKKALLGYEKQCDLEGMLHCMLSLGDTYRMTGDFELAAKNYSQAIDLAGKNRKAIWVADARVGLGLSLRALGNWKETLKLIRESERTYRKIGDQEGIAFSLWARAGALRIQGKIAESIKTFKKSLAIFKILRNEQGIGYCLCGLGGTHRIAGLLSDSLQYYTKAHTLFFRIKDRFGIAYSYCGIGNAYRMKEDYERSLANFSKAVDLYQKIGDKVSYSYTLWSIGTTYKMIGSFQKARDNFIKALILFKRTKDPRGIIYCYLGLGEIDFLAGRKAIAMKRLRMAFCEAVKHRFAIERKHAQTIISCIDGKLDKSSYNRLGLKLKCQGLPFNIP